MWNASLFHFKIIYFPKCCFFWLDLTEKLKEAISSVEN
ncbi:hypothetical protein RV12_GL001306 [Enterococcus quebecensis]|nr:hypothetical protein RV12_GL001306 [Enterococcus quebecensis]